MIRALCCIHRTGEVLLQFSKEEHAVKAQEGAGSWLPLSNAALNLRVKLYTIMVSGVPTIFDPANNKDVDTLRDKKSGLLDSLQLVRWANAH